MGFYKLPKEHLLPKLIWFYLPILTLIVFYGARAISEEIFYSVVFSEFGIIENLSILCTFVGFIYALRIVFSYGEHIHKSFRILMSLFAFGCLFLFVEETSFGQHFFGWVTPEGLAAINKQQEINLHNTTDWLDKYPRLLLGIGILVFGLILPIVATKKQNYAEKGSYADYFFPTAASIPVGLGVVIPRLIERIGVWFNVELPGFLNVKTHAYQELQETYIQIFLMMYALSIFLRLKQRHTA